MLGRPPKNAYRLQELRMWRVVRGYLTLEERLEVRRLEGLERQRLSRRARYAEDPEYRERTLSRILSWQRAQREG